MNAIPITPVVAPPALESAIVAALGRVAPLWPLGHFVAVNPFAGLLDQQRPHAHRSVFVVEEISKWCAVAFDENQATWKSDCRSNQSTMARSLCTNRGGSPWSLKGMDSLLSIVQMPAGIPTATFAIGRAGAVNAALFAGAMLANSSPELAGKHAAFRAQQNAKVKSEEWIPFEKEPSSPRARWF